MRITAEVEVVAELLFKLFGSVFLRLVKAVKVDFGAVVPPLNDRVKVVEAHGLCLGKMLVFRRHIQTVKPCFLRGVGTVKKQDIRRDRRIGRKHARRHTDDRVQVALFEQLFLDIDFRVVGAEQKTVGQNHRRASVLL